MSKSHKKLKRVEEIEERSHHNFKQLKTFQNKKQMKRIDRELVKASRNPKDFFDNEEYA